MGKRKTVAELEETIKRLQPYEEAVYALSSGEAPLFFSSGTGETYREIGVVGIERAAGGVVIHMNGQRCGALWLTDVISRWSRSVDPYEREAAGRAQRALREAVDERVNRRA